MERLCITDIEHELRFCSWLKQNKISKILFDLDDTVCQTKHVFRQQMSECVEIFGCEIDLKNEIRQDLVKTNNRIFEIHAVNPEKWSYVVSELQKRWQFSDEALKKALDALNQIYEIPLSFCPGVEKAFGFLKKTQTDYGIVTNANKLWTWKKYQWLDLQRFLSWDDIYIVNENSHKIAQSWFDAASYFQTEPQFCAVVGDSPRSDMCASRVGFKHLFLVGADDDRWVVHNTDLPSVVTKLDSAADIVHMGCCKL
jgi:phosphoglycolate phosphatase-like HAD superfamily hydrolase